MALGDYDNNSKKYYEPIVYATPYNVSNTDGVDPSALSFQFFRGLLKISIAPMKPGAKPGDRQIFDYDNEASVWLTAIKARMLLSEIEEAQKNPDTINNGGVTAGEGLVSFSSGRELGVTSPCLIIRKLDLNTGAVLSSYAYQFKTDYHYAIRNFDPDNVENFQKIYYDNLEIDMFKTILSQYVKSISGAYAYSTLYSFKYDIQRSNTKIGMIMEKLGIEKPEYNNSSRQTYGNSFFNRNEGSVSKPQQSNFMNPPASGDMQRSTYSDLVQDVTE